MGIERTDIEATTERAFRLGSFNTSDLARLLLTAEGLVVTMP